MKHWGLAALLALASCSPCMASRDCDPGQHCEFNSGDCIDGCQSNADCHPRAQCNVTTGACQPRGGTQTSTLSDAG